MRIFMLDNYDSFTYNLVQYFNQLEVEVTVRRNRLISVPEVLALRPEAIVLSPGPGRPDTAGIMPELIRAAVAEQLPLLGICLGHQALGEAFGLSVIKARRIMHGKLSTIAHDGKGLFQGISGPFRAVRYHSLALSEPGPGSELEVTARSEDGEIMGIRHRTLVIEGVQYHPESILSCNGKRQLANFLQLAAAARRGKRA